MLCRDRLSCEEKFAWVFLAHVGRLFVIAEKKNAKSQYSGIVVCCIHAILIFVFVAIVGLLYCRHVSERRSHYTAYCLLLSCCSFPIVWRSSTQHVILFCNAYPLSEV